MAFGVDSLKRYHITGVFGEAENGKTTYMVSELLNAVRTNEHYDEVYCNLKSVCESTPKIKFIDYRGLVSFKGPTKNGVARCLIGLDQFHKYLDARESGSIKNIKSTQTFIESRQHGFDTIYTTWMKSIIDKRVRPFTNLFVLAQRGRRGFEYDRIDKDAGTDLPFMRMPWEKADQVWKKFDSTELIEDPSIDQVIAEERKKRRDEAPQPAPLAENVEIPSQGPVGDLLGQL